MSRGGSAIDNTIRRLGATRPGVWAIKHIVSPLDRWLYRLTGGRISISGRPAVPILLLTTTGRKTGKQRTIPVFYLADGERVILCNVNPGFERPNPWTLNLQANPIAQLQIGSERRAYRAREASAEEIERYWPLLTQMWPAYEQHFARSEQRSIFVLEPI
ncbi:MAG: nitroreductase family deazaflavin-dependent oxidoreductase [Chloroflexota bacterium]|nr:MAG: nitroreductase family deazaflavin-dependent oxidoreductase [Chloroflexota bacterium]